MDPMIPMIKTCHLFYKKKHLKKFEILQKKMNSKLTEFDHNFAFLRLPNQKEQK